MSAAEDRKPRQTEQGRIVAAHELGLLALGSEIGVESIEAAYTLWKVRAHNDLTTLDRLEAMSECVENILRELVEAYAQQKNPRLRYQWRLAAADVECMRKVVTWVRFRFEDAAWQSHGNRRVLAAHQDAGEHVDETAVATRPKPPQFDEPTPATFPSGFPQLEWSWTAWLCKLLANRRRAAGLDQAELPIPDLPDEEHDDGA